ncbi:MAG TPA: DUF3667 domain-containing protein, partial [Gemmatimonadaceae bacterium]|nr:DUF3667 domain-containing protein [Gemmatimonadaceae bacterium]
MTIPRLESLPVDLTPAAEPPGDRCPGCDAPRPGRYCPQCGERRVDEADYSVTAFARYSLEHLSNLDGNVPRTLVRLWSPGFLATEYFAGRRTRYLRPLQVLLLVSIVVFFVLPGTGLFQWGLEQYRRSGDFAALANRMALADMARTGLAEADFTARFDRALWDQKRTTLLLLVPVFALVTMA